MDTKEIYPLCVESKTTEAKMLDHPERIAEGVEVWSYDNLQSLCTSHHNKKTLKEKKPYHSPMLTIYKNVEILAEEDLVS